MNKAMMLAVLTALVAGATMAEEQTFSVAGIFSDHMVLQRGRPVPVWGEAGTAEFSETLRAVGDATFADAMN